MNTPRDLQFAAEMAEREVRRVTSFPDMLCDIEEFRTDYARLFQKIRENRQTELDALKKSAHAEVLRSSRRRPDPSSVWRSAEDLAGA